MAKKQTYPGFEYIKSSAGISEYKLKKNGLRVLLKEDHTVPVATVMVTYHVGSRDEAVGHTGATHILEHMMFQGTKKQKNSWKVLQGSGARVNATTWTDRTNYYETASVEHLESFIELEADRMRNLVLTKKNLDSEMTVVRSELEFRVENEPVALLDQHIWATAFQSHPYHHPTIGWRSDIENTSVDKLQRFYDKFYWPNNATLTVIGDIDTAKALKLAKKYFEKVPISPHEIPKVHTTELPQIGPRTVTLKQKAQMNILGVGHRAPEGLNNDTYALQVLARVLGYGKSSRLHKALIDTNLATEVVIEAYPFKDDGLFAVYVTLADGVDHKRAEETVLAEYENIQKKGITQKEIKKAIAQIVTDTSFSRDGSFATAHELNEAIAAGDWTYYTNFKKNISAVTVEAIKKAANKYLTESQSTTGYFIAEN